jgi:hypothetical protein
MKTIALAIAWILIAMPLGWGVYQSVQKSMPLFQGQSEPVAPSRQGEEKGDRLLDRKPSPPMALSQPDQPGRSRQSPQPDQSLQSRHAL